MPVQKKSGILLKALRSFYINVVDFFLNFFFLAGTILVNIMVDTDNMDFSIKEDYYFWIASVFLPN